jgi:hypothetical protein
MVAVMEARLGVREQAESLLTLDERRAPEILAVEKGEIEQEKDQGRRVAAVRGELHNIEGGDAIGADATQLTIQIGLASEERLHGLADRRIFVGPIEVLSASAA